MADPDKKTQNKDSTALGRTQWGGGAHGQPRASGEPLWGTLVPRGQGPPHQGNRRNRPQKRNNRQLAIMSQGPQRDCPVSWPALSSRQNTRTRAQQDSDHNKYPYNIANTKRQGRRHKPPTPKRARAAYRTPHEEGDGRRPQGAGF